MAGRNVLSASALAALTVVGVGQALSAPAKPATPPKPKAVAPAAAGVDAVLARLKKDEATVKSGRISLLVLRREGEIPEDATGAAAAEALRKAPLLSQRREYLIFSGDDWKRDVTMMDPQGNIGGHVLVGMKKKVGRAFQEQGHGDEAGTAAGIGVEPKQEPADHLLFQRGHALLSKIRWTGKTETAGKITLTGNVEDGKATAVLRTAPRYALERFSVVESLLTPVGETTRTQQVSANYAVEGGALTLKSIDVADFAGKPFHKGMHVNYKVEGAQINPAVVEAELAVAIPEGTLVSDSRLGDPLRYKQGAQDLSLAELQALQEKRATTGAKVGRAAPAWGGLKALDGKSYKPEDYKGRVVLLTWFASWCGPCHAEAPIMEKEIWQKYRDRGLSVFGVNAGEDEEPAKKAQGFASQHELTYPVLLDSEDELSQTFNVQAFPTIVLIDRKGIVRYMQSGFDHEAVAGTLEKLLAEK
jgi:peroxiredoxin